MIKNQVLKSKKNLEKNYQRLNKTDITRTFFIKKFINYIKKNDKIFLRLDIYQENYMVKLKNLGLKTNPFYLVGGMGHTSSVSLGHSLNSKKKKNYMLRW